MDGKQYFERVRELSKQSGKPISQLCELAGVSRATVGFWGSGKTAPSLRTWSKFEELERTLPKNAASTLSE